MRFHGFIVGVVLAALASSAWGSTKCWNDTEKGAWTCNCSGIEVQYTGCSSSTVEVKSGNEGGVTGTFPGLSVTAKQSYSQSVSTGASECISTTIPPHHCAWFEYHFEVCLTTWVEEHWYGDKVVSSLSATFLGKSFHCEPSPPAGNC